MTQKGVAGDAASFSRNWGSRPEAKRTYWTRGEPENQLQLAFRNHWTLFQTFMKHPAFAGGRRVLEVGCGRGTLSCYFADAEFDCTLIDLSPEVIEVARSIFAENRLSARFDVGDANRLPYPDRSFDLTFSIGLLEHFEDIEPPIREQIRVLDKGGLFIGYVVPKYERNVQTEYKWINEVIKGYVAERNEPVPPKVSVFRSDSGSDRYLPVLRDAGLVDVQSDGVYPLPMISHSIDFPFSLMPPASERAAVERFQQLLEANGRRSGSHPWRCEEGFGQAFVVWGYRP